MNYLSRDVKGLPKVLQKITLQYFRSPEVLEAYDWYLSLVDDIKVSGHLRELYLLPREKLLKYLDIFLEDEHQQTVESIIEYYSLGRVNDLLEEVAKEGHLNLVKYFLSLGATNSNIALSWAAYGGQLEVIKYLISQGANDLDGALYGAAHEGHLEVVRYLISKGATNLDDVLYGAALGGHLEVVEYLVSQGANDLNDALDGAAFEGQLKMIKHLIYLGATNLTEALTRATEEDHFEVVKYLKKLIQNPSPSET